MFDVIYITETKSLSDIKINLKSGCGLYFLNEQENTFKAQIELELRDQLNLSEDDFLQIINISITK